MATKTYQAETMIEALQMVQRDLGPDAIVLSARDIHLGPAWQVWRRPGVEIVAMTPDTISRPAPAPRQAPTPSAARPAPSRPVIRPASASGGVEFASEEAEIDWVKEPPMPARPASRPIASQPLMQSPASEPIPSRPVPAAQQPVQQTPPQAPPAAPAGWQPVHLTRREASASRPVRTEPLRPQGMAEPQNQMQSQSIAPAASPAPMPVPAPRPMQAAVPVAAQPVATIDRPRESRETSRPVPLPGVPESLNKARLQLLAQGVDATLVERMTAVTARSLPPAKLNDEKQVKEYLMRQLEADLVTLRGAPTSIPNRVIALIGASGSGKTGTMAKLALYYNHVLGKKVVWVCADTVRTGAINEARSYTDALGIQLKLVYTPQDAKEAINSCGDADLILVDLPGYNPCNEGHMVELGGILTEIPNRHTYLVASATTKEADLYQTVASLGLFNIKGLVITKLDETYSFGSIYNFARKTQLPLAFYTNGKEATGTLQVADAHRLVSALFGQGWNR